MASIELTLCEDGPILLAGNGKLSIGNETVNAPAAGRVAICRCGASANKPFCDGSYRAAGFKAPAGTLAVEQ